MPGLCIMRVVIALQTGVAVGRMVADRMSPANLAAGEAGGVFAAATASKLACQSLGVCPEWHEAR
jgi:hypothetical protein